MSNLRDITAELNRDGRVAPTFGLVGAGLEFKLMRDIIPADLELVEPPVRNTADNKLDSLKAGLELAAQLEFATVPPYLVALWSVIDESHPVARSLRAIVHEEMLHMALANNMLSAIGGTPRLTGPTHPRYPAALPGGVHPELVLTLSGLTDTALDVFLEIERPLVRVPVEGVDLKSPPEVDKTISEFYAAVQGTLRELDPVFSTARQVAGPLAPMVIASLDDCYRAVRLILTQGEGGHGMPFDTGTNDLAHFYRFLEIQLGQRLTWNQERKVLQLGEPVKAPSVYPLAAPPALGWARAVPARIRWLSGEFNRLYSELLDLLEQSWGEGGHGAFLGALERMFGMRETAREMIRTPGPGGVGYAPEFRYLPLENR
ncbi:ferritin-like protein [Massilia sp. P8910]|uniref:ferritin-like domain-containing protein n=1 Tax=Massilia antarctica TaxID=2765360 RepID=UPI001E297C86|nr:ferritin-like protein [Massilia antarctica]